MSDDIDGQPPRLVGPIPLPRAPASGAFLLLVAAAAMGIWHTLPDAGPPASARNPAQGAPANLPLLDLSDPEERDRAITLLGRPRPVAEAIVAEARRRGDAIALVTVWDNRYDDGDAVFIVAGDITHRVAISNVPAAVAVPYRPGGSVQLSGARDGGGGITVSVEMAGGPVPLRIAPGETVSLPMR